MKWKKDLCREGEKYPLDLERVHGRNFLPISDSH
jgi:hypothetical protein